MQAHIERLLSDAGWFAGRQIDLSSHLRALVAEKYNPGPGLRLMLAEFAGLKFVGPGGAIVIDPSAALRGTWRSTVRYWSARVDSDLVPVGMVSDSTFLCSENLQAFAGFDDWLVECGRFPDEALDRLMFARTVKEVPDVPGLTMADFVRDDDP